MNSPRSISCSWNAAAALAGLAIAAVMILSFSLPLRWTLAVVAGVAGSLALTAIRVRTEFILAVLPLTLTLRLDAYPIHILTPHLHPVRGIGIFFYDFPLLVLIAATVIRRIRGRPTPPVSWPVFPVFGVALISALSGALSNGESGVMMLAIALAHLRCVVLFVVIQYSITHPRRLTTLAAGVAVAVLIHSAVALMQVVTGAGLGLNFFGEVRRAVTMTDAGAVTRVGGILGTENLLAKFLSMHTPLTVSLLFCNVNRTLKWWVVIPAIVMGTAASISTYSRAGWGSLALGLTLTTALCLFRKTRSLYLAIAGPLAVATVFCLLIIASPTVRARLTSDSAGTAQGRIPMMQVALNIIRHHPWRGVGFGRYVAHAPGYDRTPGATSYEFDRPVHNEYLVMAAEQGIPMMLLYIAILIAAGLRLRTAVRNSSGNVSYLAAGLLGGLFAFAVNDLTEWSWAFTMPTLWGYLALAEATIQTARREIPEKAGDR